MVQFSSKFLDQSSSCHLIVVRGTWYVYVLPCCTYRGTYEVHVEVLACATSCGVSDHRQNVRK